MAQRGRAISVSGHRWGRCSLLLAVLATLTAALREPSAAQAAGDCASTYVVATGDSWSRISHNTGIYIRPLAAANGMTRKSVLNPGAQLCVPAATAANSPIGRPKTTGAPESLPVAAPAPESPATTSSPPAVIQNSAPVPVRASCESAVSGYGRAMCMDLSARRLIIGGRDGVTHDFKAVAGYGNKQQCTLTEPGTFTISTKQAITLKRKLHWGLSFGGGCIGDQIVHAVGSGTLNSDKGTGGCLGLLEDDAKTAYDAMRVGDALVIIS